MILADADVIDRLDIESAIPVVLVHAA